MKRRAGEHKFDILIVDAVSRLARNQRDLWNVIEDFKELGIGIMIVKGNYWTYIIRKQSNLSIYILQQ